MDINKILRVNFLCELDSVLSECRYTGNEAKKVKDLIPDGINEEYRKIIDDVMSSSRTMSLPDLEKLIRDLPPGYLRSEIRQIWRERQ